MKNALFAFVVFCLSWVVVARPATAQSVPNANFENWTTQGSVEYPNSWLSTDAIYAGQGIPLALGTVVKSTDRNTGSFAAKMESKSLFGIPLPSFLILGSRFVNANTFGVGGVPYTGRPASLQFWYKLTLATNDSAGAYIALTRGGGTTAQAIEVGTIILPARATYGQVSVPVTYVAGVAPDSLRLFFLCGNGRVAASSSLWLDDITLSGTVASTTAADRAALSIYPNPSATGEFALASLQNPAVAAAPYRVYDAQGRVVRAAAAAPLNEANGRPVDLRGLPAGVYLLHLSTADGPLTRKLLIP